MRQFFLLCQKVQPVAGQLDEQVIPLELLNINWRHNVTLLSKVDIPEAIIWYAQKTLGQGWSGRACREKDCPVIWQLRSLPQPRHLQPMGRHARVERICS